ncbi:MAG: alpha/beta hydrolase [Polyangiaceae bacterium]
MSTAKKILRFVLGAALLYAVSVGVAFLVYPRVLFPAPASPPPIPLGVGEPLSARAKDGVTANALYFAPRDPNAPVVVFFHGNGETVSYDLWRAQNIEELGFGAMLAEYRGYGTASANGSPSEAGLYADAEAELEALVRDKHVEKKRIALWGFSLGTGVASEMASRGWGCAVILEAPFTSILDEAEHFTPFFPNSWIVKDRFDTLSKAPKITQPALVVQGTADKTVPFAFGERVAHALPHAEFIAVKGGHHTDLLDEDLDPIVQAAKRIVSSACRDPDPK